MNRFWKNPEIGDAVQKKIGDHLGIHWRDRTSSRFSKSVQEALFKSREREEMDCDY